MKTILFISCLLLASCASNKYTCPTYSEVSDKYEIPVDTQEDIATIIEKDVKNRRNLNTAFAVFGAISIIVLSGGF